MTIIKLALRYVGIVALIGLGFLIWQFISMNSGTFQQAVAAGALISIALISFAESREG